MRTTQQGASGRAAAVLGHLGGLLRQGVLAIVLPWLALLALALPIQVQAQTQSSTVLGSSPASSSYAQSVTLTATVSGDNPGGNVTFYDGAASLGSASLSGGVASLSTSALGVGSHSLTAVYEGDALNTTSTSNTVTQAVSQASTSTVLTSSANPAGYGTSLTLTATLSGGSNPGGSVTFKDGATTLGTGTVSNGVATYSTSALSIATHSLTAVYSGDTNHSASTSSALSQVISKATTTTAVASSVNPSNYNGAVTFTATVTGINPTGGVAFKDGTTTLYTPSLSGTGNTRTATYAYSGLGVGPHSITAVYAGDSSNATSTSDVLTQNVNIATPTYSISANPSYSATVNSNVTFTGWVNGYQPSGTLTFKDGATVLGTATLSGTGNSRSATYTTNALALGSHSITITYSGDANNNPGTSSASSYTINKYSTTTTVVSNTNPSTYGQSITLTATVSGTGSPTGNITFKDQSNNVLGTVELNGGTTAILSTSALKGGTPSYVYAYYNGDALNATSYGTVGVTVNKATPTATLSTSINPSTAGQSVTYSTTVSGVNGVYPTGSVTIKDGATTLFGLTLSNGTASLAYSNLTGGDHNLTAVYSGDNNYATSTSPLYVQTVNRKQPTLTLSSSYAAPPIGTSITLTASLAGYAFAPSGTVTFYDGGTALATVNASYSTTLTLSTLGVGAHNLTASYSGDGSHLPATTASATTVTVNPITGMSWTGGAWSYGYDAMGRINTVIDPFGQATYTYYDNLGRAIQTQQPPKDGSVTPTIIGYSYNGADALTQVADPRNLATSYSPNGLGNVTSQSSPDTGATSYTHDAAGNVLTKTDARGKTTSYAYDALNRLTSISYPTGVATTFEYDGGTTPTPAEKGELTKMVDESGSTSYSHDSLGRLSTKTVVIAGKTFTTSYSWGDTGSALDKLVAITYPSGNRVNYSYDAQGYLNAISVNPVNPNGVGTSATSTSLLGNVTYNAENKLTGWLWSDGKARSFAYDGYGQISAYNLGDAQGTGNAAGSLRALTRDAAGRIIGYSHTNNGSPLTSLDQSFGYDKLNRLTSATLNSSSTQYRYDETGNRTSKVIAGTTYTNTIASTSNKLTQTQDVNGTASILHDAAGNIVNDGTSSFSYSDRGRLASVQTAGGTVSYLYNGLNLRVYKSGPTAVVNTGAAYYLYDEQGQLLGEYDAAGNPVYETVYLGSLPVGVLKQTGSAATSDIQTTLYNLHADHIATPRVITQQDEQIVWRWDTAESFGGSVPDQNPSNLGTFVYNQRFPGQVFDAESGLFQNWNREYNSRYGRYIQSDPIGLKGGINTFAYVGGNPLSLVDPQGLSVAPSEPKPMPVPSASSPAPNMSITPWVQPSDVCVAADDGYAKRKQYCLAFCQYQLDMPGRFDNFGPHRACMRRCMGAAGFPM